MSTTTKPTGTSEAAIFARMLANDEGRFPEALARGLMECQINDADQARMTGLLQRNQQGDLTVDEQAELLAFNKAATLLSILKSKARLALGIKLAQWTDI